MYKDYIDSLFDGNENELNEYYQSDGTNSIYKNGGLREENR